MIYSGWIIRFDGLDPWWASGVGVLCIGGLGGWDGCRGILRLTYFVIRRVEEVRRNHDGCLIENVMMSSTFWYIDKLDSEVKKIRERFDSGSCATKCICISSSYFELSEACVMRIHESSWIPRLLFVRMPRGDST